jgi:hypothetical protein
VSQGVPVLRLDDGTWSVYFHNVLLGRFDEEDLKLHP